ncbi:MAG: TlpA family protein disulfide reductase [Firmicutes bacterium]|nr:TlpA family protein disulfide reductase [Bacillota bacterium]
MKRTITALLTALTTLLCCVGCAPAQTAAEDMIAHAYPAYGVRVWIPKQEYVDILFDDTLIVPCFLSEDYPSLIDLLNKIAEKLSAGGSVSEEDALAISDLAAKTMKHLLVIERREAQALDASQAENPAEDALGIPGAAEFGRQDGYAYIVYEPQADVGDLSESDLALYEACRARVPEMRERLELIPIEASEAPAALEATLPAFAAVDLMGNPITNDIFKGKKVTMINFWGTFCGPCIEEMPDLGALARNLPDGAQLIGIAGDVDAAGGRNLKLAQDIMAGANADFLNIVPDEALLAYCNGLVGVPTTIFVDENGALLGEPLLGSRSAGEYRAALEGYLP